MRASKAKQYSEFTSTARAKAKIADPIDITNPDFSTCYRLIQNELRRVVKWGTSNETFEDATQDASLILWRCLDRIRNPKAVRAYTGRIILSVLRNYRHDWRKSSLDDNDLPDIVRCDVVNEITHVALEFAIRELDTDLRVPIECQLKEMSIEEIAVAIGMSVGCVKKRLECARQILKVRIPQLMPKAEEQFARALTYADGSKINPFPKDAKRESEPSSALPKKLPVQPGDRVPRAASGKWNATRRPPLRAVTQLVGKSGLHAS